MSGPRILVIDGNLAEIRTKLIEAVGYDSGTGYARALHRIDPSLQIDVVTVADGDGLPGGVGLENYDGVTMTGSALNIYNGGAPVMRQIEFAKAVFASGVPFFGSCWGLQVAVTAAGGEVRANLRGREFGFARRILLTDAGREHWLFAGKPLAFEAPTVHRDEIASLPLFFIRDHGMATGELGTWFAVIAGVGGGAGIWLSGYMTSRFGAADERIKVKLMAAATALIAPTLAIVLWSPSKELALLILIPCQALMFFFIAPTMSLVQALSAPSTRATMASVFIFIQVLAGGVIGIQLPGVLSDLLTPLLGNGGLALRWSMTATSLLALWAAIHFWLSARTIRTDMQNASAGSGMVAQAAT